MHAQIGQVTVMRDSSDTTIKLGTQTVNFANFIVEGSNLGLTVLSTASILAISFML